MIIGLVGQARHGKSTAAEYLAKNYGFSIVSFAAPLKNLLTRGLVRNPPPGGDHTDRNPPCDQTPEQYWSTRIYTDRTEFTRWFLQFVGTDVIREVYPDYFAVAAVEEAKFKPRAVLPDCRFENEADEVRAAGGIVVRIIRMNKDGSAFEGIEYGAAHASEQAQKNIDVDYTIVAATLDELYAGVNDLINSL